jgi:transcriptional regulator with XRE-family HTH domain
MLSENNRQSDRSRPTPEEIRGARQAAGLTQRQAAALALIKPSTLSDLERGRYAMPAPTWALLRQGLVSVTAEALLRERLSGVSRILRRERSWQPRRSRNGAPNDGRLYPKLFRAALQISNPRPSLSDIAEWTGFSRWALEAWLKRPTARSHRVMPKSALRLILHELHFHGRIRDDRFLTLIY